MNFSHTSYETRQFAQTTCRLNRENHAEKSDTSHGTVCYYCNRKGHIKKDYQTRKRKQNQITNSRGGSNSDPSKLFNRQARLIKLNKTELKSVTERTVNIVIGSEVSEHVIGEQSYPNEINQLAPTTVGQEYGEGITSSLKRKLYLDTGTMRVTIIDVNYIPGMKMTIIS